MKDLPREEQLRLYEQIVANIASGVYMLRVSDGQIVYANPKFETLFGYQHRELPGMHVSKLNAPTHQTPEQVAHEIIRELVEKGEWHGEVKNIKKDGTTFWCHADVSTFNHPTYGKVFMAIHSDISDRNFTREITKQKQIELALKASEERFKKLSELTIEGIIIHKNGVCIDVNNAFEDIVGYRKEELIGQNLIELIIAEEFNDRVSRNMKNNHFDTYEVVAKRKNGDLIHVQIGSRREIIYKGEKVSVLTARAISENRKNKLKVNKSEADLISQIENTTDSIWSVDKNYRITIANSNYFQYFNLTYRHELSLGDSVLDYIPESLKPIWKGRYDKALRGKQFSVVDQFDIENMPQYIETTFNPVIVDNAIEGVACFTKNITRQKMAEKALKVSEQKFKMLSDFSPAAISILRTDKYLYVNKAWELLTGYTNEEAKTLSPLKIIHPDSVDMIKKRSDARLKGEPVPIRYDLKLLTKANEVKWIDISFSVIEYENQTASLGVFFDITELKKAKEALIIRERDLKVANATKNKFFSIIAHDLRSPFSSILGFSNLLIAEYDNLADEQRKAYIGELAGASNRTFLLLENLLNWARAQQGGIVINKVSLNLKSFIYKAIEPYVSRATHKNIEINSCISDEISIIADEYTILTVIGNLFNNAVKYSYTAGRIDIKAQIKNRNTIISISDAGVGMTPNMVSKLFLLDENFSTPGTNNEQGTGLGLILCKEFIELNGGSIMVESEKGKGSTFSILLPRKSG